MSRRRRRFLMYFIPHGVVSDFLLLANNTDKLLLANGTDFLIITS